MPATTQPHIHPPHQETWDGGNGTMRNRDGNIRKLDACEVTEFGMYGERLFHRPAARAIGQRVWLLPRLDLRIISWIPRPGTTGVEDYYIDIASITTSGRRYQMIDYYLDIRLWTGRRAEVDDQDEFLAAIAAGHLDQKAGQQALESAFRTLDGLAAHGYHLSDWLVHDHDIRLTWR